MGENNNNEDGIATGGTITTTTTATSESNAAPVERELPKIKLIKLKNGETLIAMTEWGVGDDEDILTLYNPFKILFGEMMRDTRTPVLMEEWLPAQIAQEQVCEVFMDDILTMVDVNEGFSKAYTKSVLKKVQLDELIRRGTLGKDKLLSAMAMSEEEAEEDEAEEIQRRVEEALKKFRGEFN